MLLYIKNLNYSADFQNFLPTVCVHFFYIYLYEFYQWILIGWFPSKSLKPWREIGFISIWYFDQVYKSGVYTNKVSQSKSIKVTWSKFDQSDFNSVNQPWDRETKVLLNACKWKAL